MDLLIYMDLCTFVHNNHHISCHSNFPFYMDAHTTSIHGISFIYLINAKQILSVSFYMEANRNYYIPGVACAA